MVDVDNGIITLPPGTTKNKKGRHYYMPDEMCHVFRRMWNDRRNAERAGVRVTNYVFAKRDYVDRIRDIRGAWKNSCERAGLQGKLTPDFRRTAARNYIRAGVPQRVAQELLGHQTASIFERYNIVSDEDLKEAVKKQTEYLNSQGKEKPAALPPEEARDWETIILPVNGEVDEGEEGKPFEEVMKEIRENYEKQKNTGTSKKNSEKE